MNDDTDKMNEEVSQAAEALSAKTEERLLRAYVTSLLSTSAVIDKFSTWLMAGIGAAATLLITNIASITSIAAFENVKDALLLLIVAGLFGFLEKVLARDIQVNLLQEESLQKILASISADYEHRRSVIQGWAEIEGKKVNVSINIKRVLKQYASFHPWIIRRKLRQFDPLVVVLKKGVYRYYWQTAWAVLELLFFLVFVLLMAFSI
jgi:hypothetical protein